MFDRKAYMKAYDARPERKAYKKAYDARPERKAYKKAYNKAKLKYQREHPDEYLDVLGRKVYTNGMTKKLKKELPMIIDYTIKKILNENR